MIWDGPSRQFRFVREEAIRAETEIQDLSTDAPKTIESREIKQFILTFQNYGERYGLDSDWPAGYYSWYIDLEGEGEYRMKFSISGDSYMILQYDEIVDREYVEGLADLIAEKGIAEYNGYYMKNNTDKTGYYLYVKYTSKEKLTIRTEGDTADTCPFDIPALLDYAYKATGEKNGNLYY
ncbi:MAG: hypothetical protein J5849_04300, partial [Clostridia bacterium]|nr:hypothetical protein [Clostridia bacterium]